MQVDRRPLIDVQDSSLPIAVHDLLFSYGVYLERGNNSMYDICLTDLDEPELESWQATYEGYWRYPQHRTPFQEALAALRQEMIAAGLNPEEPVVVGFWW